MKSSPSATTGHTPMAANPFNQVFRRRALVHFIAQAFQDWLGRSRRATVRSSARRLIRRADSRPWDIRKRLVRLAVCGSDRLILRARTCGAATTRVSTESGSRRDERVHQKGAALVGDVHHPHAERRLSSSPAKLRSSRCRRSRRRTARLRGKEPNGSFRLLGGTTVRKEQNSVLQPMPTGREALHWVVGELREQHRIAVNVCSNPA